MNIGSGTNFGRVSPYKVNYSELVTALQDNNYKQANELLKKLQPDLQIYLRTVLDADIQEAEEAIQRAMAKIIEKILNDQIHNKKYIYKYLLRTCRNECILLRKDAASYVLDSKYIQEMSITPAEQINNLLDEEHQRILKSCLDELPEDLRNFISYIIEYPGVTSPALSERFDITPVNARVKKSRIINILIRCVERKWNK
jgi:RNA polymerase sigma factor (sigma-70 family)